MAAVTRQRKKGKDRKILHAVARIKATFNNTLVVFTDPLGNAIGSSSAGAVGFKGSRKGTPFAAQVASEKAADLVKDYEIESLEIRVKGAGPGRESAILALYAVGYKITQIVDETPIPHNGCRPPKKRRV